MKYTYHPYLSAIAHSTGLFAVACLAGAGLFSLPASFTEHTLSWMEIFILTWNQQNFQPHNYLGLHCWSNSWYKNAQQMHRIALLTVLVLCLCRAGGVSLHTLKETGDKSNTIQWHLDATGFWLITIHSTKPLLHVLRVVTLIQGSFSTQILASKMSFGFAEITHLNYVLFSGRKKYKPGLSHSASLAYRFCTG